MITYITDEIAIGDAEDAKTITTEKFDATVNVAVDLNICDVVDPEIRNYFVKRHKVGLVDGAGNDPLTFMAAVLLLHSLVKNGRRVLLHCQAGTSRSVMVGATYIAVLGYTSLDDALEQIMSMRKVGVYRMELYNLAQSVIPKIKEVIKS